MEIFKQDLYTKSGIIFAKEFVRVVHGGRGDYVEFTKNQILPLLAHKFSYKTDEELIKDGHYYEWLIPLYDDSNTKVYRQLKTVKYADYKVGYYYVSPEYFENFKDPEKLF